MLDLMPDIDLEFGLFAFEISESSISSLGTSTSNDESKSYFWLEFPFLTVND